MNLRLIGILLIVILAVGCSKELTTEEIQNRLIQANSNLNSYSIDMKMTMSLITEFLGQKINVKTNLDSEGYIDRLNKKMVLKAKVESDISGVVTEMDADTYIVDSYVYAKTMNTWTKTELRQDIWTQQDPVTQIVELVQSGSIERLEDEIVDENSYYVVRIKPDLKKVVELALKQQKQSGLMNQNMDFEDMIRSYSSTVWINKKTFVVEQSKTDMKMVMTAENMGVDTKSFTEIDMDSSVEIKLSNINEDVVINLPGEAMDARDVTESQGNLNKKAITGNAIASVFG